MHFEEHEKKNVGNGRRNVWNEIRNGKESNGVKLS